MLASRFSKCLLCALLKPRGLKGERTAGCHNWCAIHGVFVQGRAHRALCALLESSRVASFSIKAGLNSALGVILLDSGLNAVRFERVLKLINAITDLILGLLELLFGDSVKFLGLLELELELLTLAVTLPLLVLLPVFDSLLVPLLHEAGVALKLVDLDAAHLLLAHGGYLAFLILTARGNCCLSVLLFLELQQVRLHVQLLLWLVERVNACLEELMLHSVVLFLRVGNLLSRLVVAKLARLGQHGDICRWVDLLKHHLELIKKAQSDASLALHNLVDHLGVELDVQVAQCWLQFLKVLQSV